MINLSVLDVPLATTLDLQMEDASKFVLMAFSNLPQQHAVLVHLPAQLAQSLQAIAPNV